MTTRNTTITVLGAGYVGLTTAALLAHAGYKVFVVEPNPKRLGVIKKGKSFFFEHGLDPLIKMAIDSGDLLPTDSYADSVPHSGVVFSCVGTPENPDGSSNLNYVFAAAKTAAELAKPGTIYVQKSTVPVGTGTKIEEMFTETNKQIDYISNPEFLRESTALYDTLFFDRVVVGGRNIDAVDTIMHIYMTLEKFRDHIAYIAKIPVGSRGDQYIATTLNSAELIKVTANAFLALKISFANSIALLADKAGADITEVMDAVGADGRIGRSFLNAGRGYGGGCFPKDVSGLIASGLGFGVDLEIMHAVQTVNQAMPGYIVDRLRRALGGDLTDVRVTVLGLAFKAGTSDARRSPGVAIANQLHHTGARVTVFDPEGQIEASDDLVRGIAIAKDTTHAITGANATIISTEWPEFLNYPADEFAAHMTGSILFDTVNQYDAAKAIAAGLTFMGIGRHAADTQISDVTS